MPVNANAFYPYASGAGANVTEAQWREFARFFVPGGVLPTLNQLRPFGDSTGLQAKVNTGAAWIQGAYGEWTTGVSVLGLAAVGGIAGGSERWDRLVARNDFVNKWMTLDVLTGTPAVPPGPRPALTQSSSMWETLLADVGPLVNTTTTVTAGMVVDLRGAATGGIGTPPGLGTAYKARARGTTATSMTSATAVKIGLQTKDWDPFGSFDAVTNFRYTAPWDGFYVITGMVSRVSITTVGPVLVALIYKNGTNLVGATSNARGGGTISTEVCITTIEYLLAGDFIELWGFQDDAAAQNTMTTVPYQPYLAIHYLG